MTLTLVRDAKPVGLFKKIEVLGGKVTRRHPGIYDVTKMGPIATQVLVTRELGENHEFLGVLSEKADEAAVRRFIKSVSKLSDKGDVGNASSVTTVSFAANADVKTWVLQPFVNPGH